MTINPNERVNMLQQEAQDQTPVLAKIQQKILKDAINGENSPQSQLMQLLISAPQMTQVQQTAQQQMKSGYLDVKV